MFASPRIRTSHLRILKLKLSPLSHHNDVKLPGMYVYNVGQTLYDRLSSEEQEKLEIVSISSNQILFKSYKYIPKVISWIPTNSSYKYEKIWQEKNWICFEIITKFPWIFGPLAYCFLSHLQWLLLSLYRFFWLFSKIPIFFLTYFNLKIKYDIQMSQ